MDRSFNLTPVHECLDQGEARPDFKGLGRTILEIAAPPIGPGGGAFEAGGPDRHARVFQGGSRPCIGKESGGEDRVRVGDLERLIEKTLPVRDGGRAAAPNATGGHDGRHQNQGSSFCCVELHMPRASASPSARIRTSSSRK